MKQLYSTSLLMLLLTGACALGSCSDDDKSQPDTPPKTENKFSFNEQTQPLRSAVYEMKETAPEGDNKQEETTPPVYTFYLSPTQGLTDVNGMNVADNYIKVVSNQVNGDVDLSIEGNEIAYQDLLLNAANAGQAAKSEVSVKMLSTKVVSIALDIEVAGKKLTASYYGLCSKQAGAEEEGKIDILLDQAVNSYYLGQAREGDSHNYYFIFANAKCSNTGKGGVALAEPGYMLVTDLYALPKEDVYDMPTGEYMPSMLFEDHTYDKNFSGVSHLAEDGTRSQLPLVEGESIMVSKQDDVWTISARVVDYDGVERSIAFQGAMKIKDMPAGGAPSLPQIGHDVNINCFTATASYYGNMMNSSTGMMWINIYDEKYQNNKGENGMAVCLVLFHDLFGNPKDAKLMPGTYEVNQSFKHSTWLPAIEIPMQGMVFPFGTYAQMDDGSNFGQFSYAHKGTVTIEEGQHMEQYKITFDLESLDGYKITGSYEGTVPVTDASDDKDPDDGTSTLERDYDMDLSGVNTATYHVPSQVYVQGIDYQPTSNYDCGFQIINIGLEIEGEYEKDFVRRKPGGDIFRMELCTEKGKENVITPGEYKVQPDRWPDYFKPGNMLPGIVLEGAFTSSRWMHQDYKVDEKYGYVFEWMDGHALIYDGVVTISEVPGKEGHYKFEIDGICGRKHHVRGTWEGPIEKLGGSKTSDSKNIRTISNKNVREMSEAYRQAAHQKTQMGK